MSEQQKPQEPIERLKDRLVEVAIWKNSGKNGVYYTISAPTRSYKDANDKYQNTTTLKGTDALQAALLLERAYVRVRELEDADYQASKQG